MEEIISNTDFEHLLDEIEDFDPDFARELLYIVNGVI